MKQFLKMCMYVTYLRQPTIIYYKVTFFSLPQCSLQFSQPESRGHAACILSGSHTRLNTLLVGLCSPLAVWSNIFPGRAWSAPIHLSLPTLILAVKVNMDMESQLCHFLANVGPEQTEIALPEPLLSSSKMAGCDYGLLRVIYVHTLGQFSVDR